jgi:two-component system CheB/CheR fusion protein
MGTSESLGPYRELFEVEDAKHRIYVKKPGSVRGTLHAVPSDDPTARRHEDRRHPRDINPTVPDVHREADRILLTRYAPASVLVNGDMDIVQFRGETDRYLGPAPGKASFNLLKMLREGLMPGVRAAIVKAKREDEQVREEGLHVRSDGRTRSVNIQVIPVAAPKPDAERHYLVLFEDSERSSTPRRTPSRPEPRKGRKGRPVRSMDDSNERETARLRQELAVTSDYLQSVIEQQEAANEELQSANEEVQSANEELQSINEELETSKEEIQSTNEELATLNEELHTRNLELGLINDDFSNLLSSVQVAIVMLGPDFRIRRFTPIAEKMLNLIAADVGRPITDIQLGVEVPQLEQMLTEVMDTVSVRESEVLDKQAHWQLLRIRPYRTMDNRIDGVVLVFHDVDDLKRQQAILHQQGELLEQAHEPVFMWELDGGITYWNRGAEETYGFTKEEALGRKSYELLATSPPPSVFLEALAADGQWIGELTHVGRDGQRIAVDSRMSMERGGERRSLVFESDHVTTEHKRLERTLRERADELALADRNKDTFLALLAHELRNPLAPLTSALGVLTHESVSPAMAERAGGIMTRQIRNMSRLIDDLLDVSRMNQGRIELKTERTDIPTLVERALEGSRHHTDARGQTVSLSAPPEGVPAEVDPLRIEQVLSNLINNASKFSGRGGQIAMTVEPPSANTDPVVIRVRDNGIGIAPDQLPLVFDLFMQADPSINRATGGLGIGLSLVRHLVELHGGSVTASSAGLGKGSEFVVRLPANVEGSADTQETPRKDTSISPAASRRILVTDDNIDGADTLAMILRTAGHEVRVAHDGPSTLEIATTFQPEIIFLDIGMPGQDGYETAKQLRQIAALDGTVLVALTGYGRDTDRQRAREAGFDEFLVKPALPEVISALAASRRR